MRVRLRTVNGGDMSRVSSSPWCGMIASPTLYTNAQSPRGFHIVLAPLLLGAEAQEEKW